MFAPACFLKKKKEKNQQGRQISDTKMNHEGQRARGREGLWMQLQLQTCVEKLFRITL